MIAQEAKVLLDFRLPIANRRAHPLLLVVLPSTNRQSAIADRQSDGPPVTAGGTAVN